MIFVLDASAMIAYLRDESGAAAVADALVDPGSKCRAEGIIPGCSTKRPKDANELAYQIMLESTGRSEAPAVVEAPKNPHAVALGRMGRLKGRAARAAAMTPVQRSAAAKRWGKG